MGFGRRSKPRTSSTRLSGGAGEAITLLAAMFKAAKRLVVP